MIDSSERDAPVEDSCMDAVGDGIGSALLGKVGIDVGTTSFGLTISTDLGGLLTGSTKMVSGKGLIAGVVTSL